MTVTKKKRTIKVMHLITSLDIGGAETMLMRVVNHFNRDVFLNLVVCLTQRGKIGDQIEKNGFEVVYLDMPRGKLTIKGLNKLIKYMVKYRPDILQTWLYHSDLIGLIIGKLLGLKAIIWNIRCTYIDVSKYHPSTKFVIKINALLSKLPVCILSNSDKAIEYHKRLGYRNKRWKMIPNGVDINTFKPQNSYKQSLIEELEIDSFDKNDKNIFFIGCVARFDPMKDYETLLSAAKYVLKQTNQIYFLLVGRDVEWNNSFFQTNIPEELRSRILLLGERIDIERIMASLDLFLLTSYGEGFPNVLCEAMATGVPCIATDVGDCKKIIGNTGFTVEAKNPSQISQAINRLLKTTPQERKALGEAARQRVMDHYTIAAVTDMYTSLYERLLTGPQGMDK